MIVLDAQQQAAVDSTAKKTMVIAGPGSGKTRVLVERIAHLLHQLQAEPEEIICFSFTRKSAGELKERLLERLGGTAHGITCGTSHSVALDCIRKFDPQKARHSVYGDTETAMVLKDVAEEIGVFKKTWKIPKKEIDKAFLDYATWGIHPDPHSKVSGIFDAFRHRMRQNRAFTYDDLLIEFWQITAKMAADKAVPWKHLFVDEAQDLTPMQWKIVNAISERFGASIFAVGDPDQQIYSFRGSDSGPMMRAAANGYQVFRLESNYRSLPEIVEASNNVIRHNVNRIDKQGVPVRPETDGDTVAVMRDIDSRAIAEMVSAHTGEIAVLARNHFLLQKVSGLLSDANVKHVYAGNKTNMLKEMPAVTVHSFLRLLVNHYDNFSFMVVRKSLGVNDQDYAKIRYHAQKNNMSHVEMWAALNEMWTGGIVNFFQEFDGSDYLDDVWQDLMVEYWNFTGIDYAHIDDFIKSGLEKNLFLTVKSYLDYIATFDVQDEITDDGPGVTLSTIHAAKGLEFDTVIVAGLNEGIFPSSRAEAEGEIEQERNLAFVAFSRAKDQLILTVRLEVSYDKYMKEHNNPESRFVKEAN